MTERRRNERVLMRALFGMTVAVGVLVLSVVIFGDNAADKVREGENRARLQQNQQLRAGCARAVERDRNALADAEALTALLEGPARARASLRASRIRDTIPRSFDPVTIAEFCRNLYPVPTPDPE